MPLYDFRCPACGVFEALYPMDSVPGDRSCRTCSETATRIYSPVGLSRLGTARANAIADGERSASAPEVVSGPTPGSSTAARVTHDPRHLKLPRP